MPDFAPIDPSTLTENPFKLVGKDWMLITAGNSEAYKTMTASWGGTAVLWARGICFCVVRPGRHTHGFLDDTHHPLEDYHRMYLGGINHVSR